MWVKTDLLLSETKPEAARKIGKRVLIENSNHFDIVCAFVYCEGFTRNRRNVRLRLNTVLFDEAVV